MASIVKRPNKHRWIQWTDAHGKRQTLRLGQITQRDAEAHQRAVETILSARAASSSLTDLDTARFLGRLPQKIRLRYESLGLCESTKEPETICLEAYLENYYSTKAGKASSKVVWSHTRKRLIEFFGAARELKTINALEARAFRKWLETSNKRDKEKQLKDGTVIPVKRLSENTIRKRIGIAREVFGAAVADGLIERNPFEGAGPVTVSANTERQYYIDLETFDKVLAKAPNARWRCLLVLARIGALRVPSEVLRMKWSHVAFDAKRITVLSSKTEHHKGKGSRVIPLFARVETELLKLLMEPSEGDSIFPDIDGGTNLRTQLLKILNRAGVQPWPRLWHNLRASGATDMARNLPAHVAATICGHTIAVAREHYWQTLDADLDTSLQLVGQPPKQKPKQHLPERLSKEGNRREGEAVLSESGANSQGISGNEWTPLDSNQ